MGGRKSQLMTRLSSLSLKYKLVLLLVLLTGSTLSTYGLLALRDFERDKIAYVLDSSLAYSRSTALQLNSEIKYNTERVKFLMRGYDMNNHKFHFNAVSQFHLEEQISSVMTFVLRGSEGKSALKSTLAKAKLPPQEAAKMATQAQGLVAAAIERELAIHRDEDSNRWFLALKFARTDRQPIVVVSAVDSAAFLSAFSSPQIQDSYVVDKNFNLVISPVKTYALDSRLVAETFHQVRTLLKTPEGVAVSDVDKDNTLLVAMANVGLGDLKILSIVPRNTALKAVKMIMLKSAVFLLLLFFITVIISIFASLRLTASLTGLLYATREIAKGNFTVNVRATSGDEIGSLANGFTVMTNEINRLMVATAEKARMESELKTAQSVQSMLFPKNQFSEDGFEISGFYLPASECSGDWWHHQKVGNKTLFCVADATGHGVPAALLTAAARSAASAIDMHPDIPVSDIMSMFNRAIYSTAHGELYMTMFLGLYDPKTATISYSNASHEPPFIYPHKPDLKKEDIRSLPDAQGPHLGRAFDSQYKTTSLRLNEGDRLVIFTDGILDVKNGQNKKWGERSLLKTLVKCSQEQKNLTHTSATFSEAIADFRGTQNLDDDVTYLFLTRLKAS
jgi:sigma-B regulation protein RsbU (phosphoserine phosphatase)